MLDETERERERERQREEAHAPKREIDSRGFPLARPSHIAAVQQPLGGGATDDVALPSKREFLGERESEERRRPDDEPRLGTSSRPRMERTNVTDVGITEEAFRIVGWRKSVFRRPGENTLRGMDLYYVTAAAGSPSGLISGRRLELILHASSRR